MMTYRPKKIANQIHRFIRWAAPDAQFPGAAGPSLIRASNANQNLAYTFRLRDVVNSIDFVSLYDQYRINKVTVYLERFNNNTGDSAIVTPTNIRIRVVHDYNDADPLLNESNYLEYSNCKSYNSVGGGVSRIVLYPRVASVIENVAGGQAFTAVPSNKMWLNTVDDRTPHFGLKMFIPGFITTAEANLFNVRVKFDLSFKNSK